MTAAIAALLVGQLLGEVLVRALTLPLPGPVAGMVLLFVALLWRGRGRDDPRTAVPIELGRVADTLLMNLSLLFIPAAVGIVQYLELLRDNGLVIAVSVVVSTVAALVLTALTFRAVARWVTPALGHSAGRDDRS